jgi:hypothetical protein
MHVTIQRACEWEVSEKACRLGACLPPRPRSPAALPSCSSHAGRGRFLGAGLRAVRAVHAARTGPLVSWRSGLLARLLNRWQTPISSEPGSFGTDVQTSCVAWIGAGLPKPGPVGLARPSSYRVANTPWVLHFEFVWYPFLYSCMIWFYNPFNLAPPSWFATYANILFWQHTIRKHWTRDGFGSGAHGYEFGCHYLRHFISNSVTNTNTKRIFRIPIRIRTLTRFIT